jgi:hypothetical protein
MRGLLGHVNENLGAFITGSYNLALDALHDFLS